MDTSNAIRRTRYEMRRSSLIIVALLLVVFSIAVRFRSFIPVIGSISMGFGTDQINKGKEESTMLAKNENLRNFRGSNDACKMLAYHAQTVGAIPSPHSVWLFFRNEILNATFNDLDDASHSMPDKYRHWLEWLLTVTSGERLKRALHGGTPLLPEIKKIVQRRYDDPVNNPPLRIGVLGGSITAGSYANRNNVGFPEETRYSKRIGWPERLEKVINGVAGFTLVELENVAVSASTSTVGALVVQYDLWPSKIQPDIILADFAVNDAVQGEGTDGPMEQMKALAEAVLHKRRCDTKLPLLINFDENFGKPFQGSLDSLSLQIHGSLVKVAEWYNHPVVSYIDVFTPYIQADWNDTNFKGRTTKTRSDPHGEKAFHVSAAWVIAYAFLDLAMNYCATEGLIDNNLSRFPLATIPEGPIPSLTKTLDYADVGDIWRENTLKEQVQCSKGSTQSECDWQWIANKIGGIPTNDDIVKVLKPKLIRNFGWNATGDVWRNKHSWKAQREKATFVLKWTAVHEIRSITILSMQSYSEIWKNTKIRMSVNAKERFVWSGYHEDSTSQMKPFKYVLAPENSVLPGQPIEIIFKLIEGEVFQIHGMFFCSS